MTWHKEIISIDVKTMHKFSHKMLIFTTHKNSSKIQCSNWSREMLALAMNHFTNDNIIFTNNSNKLHLLPLLQDPVMNPIISLQGQAQCQGGDMLTNVWTCHHDLLDSLPTNKIICQWLIGQHPFQLSLCHKSQSQKDHLLKGYSGKMTVFWCQLQSIHLSCGGRNLALRQDPLQYCYHGY